MVPCLSKPRGRYFQCTGHRHGFRWQGIAMFTTMQTLVWWVHGFNVSIVNVAMTGEMVNTKLVGFFGGRASKTYISEMS